MMFESVRWGLPNVSVIAALAAMSLASFAMPEQPSAAPNHIENLELDASTFIDVQTALLE